MSKLVLPKATTAARTAATPIEGEILFDKDTKTIFAGNGTTPGGVAVADTRPRLGASSITYLGVNTKPTVQVTDIVANGSNAVATVTGSHSFVPGDSVNLDSTTNFNGSFVLTSVTPSTLTWTSAAVASENALTNTYARFVQNVTRADAQSAINSIPRDLNGYSATLRFYDGYYDMGGNSLDLIGFVGGDLTVRSNAGTMNAVKISADITGASKGVFYTQYNPCNMMLFGVNIENRGNAATNLIYGMYASYGCAHIRAVFVRFLLPNAPTSYETSGLFVTNVANVSLEGCSFVGGRFGLNTIGSSVFIVSGTQTGANPLYGLHLNRSSGVGVAPVGSTANVLKTNATIL